MQHWSEKDTSLKTVYSDAEISPSRERTYLLATAQPSFTSEPRQNRMPTNHENSSQPLAQDQFEMCLEHIELKEQKKVESQEADFITEFIKLSKREVSAVIGRDARKINYICESTQCRIVVMPVSFESINIRVKGLDSPQTLSLTGRMQEVVQAKVMLRRALMELKTK